MFQSYALFPHMSVADNVAFGLEMEKKPTSEIRSTVADMLDLVHLADMSACRPSQLFGGLQQRVALARALAKKPQMLLLDESLSALDFKLRRQMQTELKRIQRETGIPKSLVPLTVPVPFNDADALEARIREMETDDEAPACLIMEACLMNMSIVPPGPGCLEKVREITKRHGIVLIFDELNSYLMEGCIEVVMQGRLRCLHRGVRPHGA